MSRWPRSEIHERTRRFHVNPLRVLSQRLRTIVVSRNPYTRLYSAYIDKVFMPLFWEHFKSIPSVTKLPHIFINRTIKQFSKTYARRPSRFQRHVQRFTDNNITEIHKNDVSRVCMKSKLSGIKLRECYRQFQRRLAEERLKSYKLLRREPLPVLMKIRPICANNVTFEEFLQYIINETKFKRSLEPHWAPITHLCRPCKFNTYKIIKQESFAADVEHTLESFGIDITNFGGLKDSLTERRAETSIPGIAAVIMTKAASPTVRACTSPTEIAERMWKSFQIQGFISDAISLPVEQLPANKDQLRTTLIRLALDAVKQTQFTREQQKAQRRKYLEAAYSHVSPDVIRDIQSTYILDFNLFNYSLTPPHLA